ncbi:hypothetical protein ACFSCV_10165 [Methylopila henanensis]|uniref:HNH endonuclease n=1 Tax=Methylopila henanensis TaxID=873516 RepID=A0ABW4K5F6_9HYPH
MAAHISAASPGGARYNEDLTPEQRSDITNGIWLCQTHAKLIDDDEISFPSSLLEEWKELAEHMAALEARGFSVQRAAPFKELEEKCPKLLAEMREDLKKSPLVREFIILSRHVIYGGNTKPFFHYFF